MSAFVSRDQYFTAEERAFSQIVLHRPRSDAAITVGLVNNMPDAELYNTEYQFRSLLAYASAATDLPVRLQLFSIPEIPRSEAGKRYVDSFCEDVAQLEGRKLDALIVTGSEPRAPSLTDEPYWKTFGRLVDWATENTHSAIWSCLAAHACVFKLDEIERNAFGKKLSGVFNCKVVDTNVLDGAPNDWAIPHSRFNGLTAPELRRHAYHILSQSPGAGPDTFVKQLPSLFVFFQGHPEYDPEALSREYRRDVGRYLRGVSEAYPCLPQNYFDAAATELLLSFRDRALQARSVELFTEFPSIAQDALLRRWQKSAGTFYAGWLRHIAQARTKVERQPPRPLQLDLKRNQPDCATDRENTGILFPSSTQRRGWQDRLNGRLTIAAENVKTGSPTPRIDFNAFAHELAQFDFETKKDFGALLDWTIAAMETGNVQPTHPRYMGLFNPKPTFPAECADRIVSAFNPQLATAATSPVAIAIESNTIAAIARRAGFAATSAGHFTTGGSEANMTALLCALTRSSPRFANEGSRAFDGAPLVYVSQDSHLAWLKIAHATGIGRQAVRFVPTDGHGRMDIARLSDAIGSDRARRGIPVMIVATAGTTNAGVIDPLEGCADIAKKAGIWFHVDAAWGGALIVSDRLRPLLSGLERADSFTLDAHKWLAATMGCGMFVTKHADAILDAFHLDAGFMPTSAAGPPNPFASSLQWSRRFVGLRLFLSLAAAGWEGYEQHIHQAISRADQLRAILLERGWRILNHSPLAVICAQAKDTPANAIVKRVLASGSAWVSKAQFEGEDVVRICVTNGETTSDDIVAVADSLESARSPLQHCNGHATA